MTKSNHRPLVLDTDYLGGLHERARTGKKRFEAWWLKEETVEEIIKAAWLRAWKGGEATLFMQKAN